MDRTSQSPETPDCITSNERLGEMPEFARNGVFSNVVRNRGRLAELCAAKPLLSLFSEDPIQIDVEATQVLADEQEPVCRVVPMSSSGAAPACTRRK